MKIWGLHLQTQTPVSTVIFEIYCLACLFLFEAGDRDKSFKIWPNRDLWNSSLSSRFWLGKKKCFSSIILTYFKKCFSFAFLLASRCGIQESAGTQWDGQINQSGRAWHMVCMDFWTMHCISDEALFHLLSEVHSKGENFAQSSLRNDCFLCQYSTEIES